MQFRAFKYLSPVILFVLALLSFLGKGWVTFLPMFWSYLLIPVAELFIRPNETNMDEAEEAIARADNKYDYMLYLVPLAMYASLLIFLFSLQQPGLSWVEYAGRISSMGLLCGVFGINVAHELGHRVSAFEQFLAKSLLLTSLYMHFIIEHNKGHHKRVATAEDPASARQNEWLYPFYIRSVVFSYIGAWQIANKEVRKAGRPVFGFYNQMVRFTIIQLAFMALIVFAFGWLIAGCFVLSAIIGIALLETVNYIEHYGLQRQQVGAGKYERAMPQHSWNSNHLLGRMMLFELSRHSDHHFLASRKYQLLRHHSNSPQLPTGYPGMMILALIPPVYIRVMNKRIRQYKQAAGPSSLSLAG